MTTATFLIGLPACGKTTWRDNSPHDAIVASSDDFIEAIAKASGKTYNDVFQDAIGPATKHFDHMVYSAVESNRNLIVDRTNLTVKTRARVMQKIPVVWKKTAIVFKFRDFEEWKGRLMSRKGKLIPAQALMDMIDRYEKPTRDEGFDEVFTYFS